MFGSVLSLWITLALACGGTTPPPAAAPPPADPHAGHGGGSGHMEQMAANRTALRAALGPAYESPVPGLDAADAARGKVLYDASCAGCHGATGKGDGPAGVGLQPPPSDLTDAFHARYYSDAGRVYLIEKGSAGVAMPAFEGTLDHAQVLDVYAHLRALREPATPH